MLMDIGVTVSIYYLFPIITIQFCMCEMHVREILTPRSTVVTSCASLHCIKTLLILLTD